MGKQVLALKSLLRICMLFMVAILGRSMADTIPIDLQNGSSAIAIGTYTGAEDTYLRETYPSVAPGKYNYLQLGYDFGKCRSMLRFDISGLKPLLIPGTTTVKGARLTLTLNVVMGTPVTSSKPIYLYRVSTANKNWAAGNLTTRTDSAANTTCWRYRIWNNNVIPPVTGVAQHQPWAGSMGASTPGTDYFATPVATGSVSSTTAGNSSIVFDFTNVAFLASWINDATANEGFIMMCPDLESGTSTAFTTLRIYSSDYGTVTYRPKFQVVLENYDHGQLGAIEYTLPSAGKLSMTIADSTGYVVKQLLMGATGTAGVNYQPWDCKRDAVHLSDTLNRVVPDGKYTVKMLVTPGLKAEYLLNLGYKDPSWKPWPGSHVAPNGIALDSTGIIMGSGGSEGAPGLAKIAYDGTYLWASPGVDWPGAGWGGSCALRSKGDTLYGMLINGQIQRIRYSRTGITNVIGAWNIGFSTNVGFGNDMALGKTSLIAANPGMKIIRWISIPSGTMDSAISVPGVMGVAMDTAGNALVSAGDSILKFTRGNPTPTVFIGTGLKMPTRLDVNPTNGDVYVLEGDTGAITWSLDPRKMPADGARWQIKRFSATGVLLGTFGALGGRNMSRGGSWATQKSSFAWVNNISVKSDGSFYVTEAWAPRRVAHFSNTGAFIEEWLAPPQMDLQATANPKDPTEVWYNTYGGYMLRARVDYVNKSYTLLGYYNTGTSPLTTKGWGCDGPVWDVQSRGGKTYLYWTGSPAVCVLDTVGDSLRAVAVGFNNFSNGANPAYPVGSITWNDLNGDGHYQLNEAICYAPTPTSRGSGPVASIDPGMSRQATYNMYMDSNFVYYGMFYMPSQDLIDSISFLVRQPAGKYPIGWGPGVFTPTRIEHVSGADIPVWDYKNVTWPTQGYPAGMAIDSLGQWGPGLAYKQYSYGVWPYVIKNTQEQGAVVDDSGNILFAINYEANASWQRVPPEAYGFGGNGGNYVMKFDRTTGKNLWMAGKHAISSTPSQGEAVEFNGVLGTAHGCIITRDYYHFQYVWNKDGLWVGRLLENIVDYQKTNPSIVSAIGESSNFWGEQFAGTALEIKDDNTPGLAKGDVLFFALATNNVPIIRITGWEGWTSIQTEITVVNGHIVGQAGQTVAVQGDIAAVKKPSCGLSVTAGTATPRIHYSVASKSPVKLEIYTVLGQKIATLIDQTLDAGVYSVDLTGSNVGGKLLRSGYYVVKLNAGSAQLTKSFVKMR